MNDFLTFRRMITPLVIQGVFWLGVAVSVIIGLTSMMAERGSILFGLLVIIVGPFMVRIFCELIILLFRMNETLTDIKNK